jgi:hypothetical protein
MPIISHVILERRISIKNDGRKDAHIAMVRVMINAEIISKPKRMKVTTKIAVAEMARFMKASCQTVEYCSSKA